MSLTKIERVLLTKELHKVSAALESAFRIVAREGNLDRMKKLRGQQQQIGTLIVELNGGPVVKIAELLS